MRTWKQRILRILCFLVLFSTLGEPIACAVKRASIVICAETGAVHHEHNADDITHPASLTKMMTLYLTFKALREGKISLHQKLPVSKHASLQAPSKLGLKPGTTITVHQAILALVTKSANDAAVALAEALGKGSESHFAELMTQQARKLGMTATIFKNASGLPNMQQITTAREMAILSRALYKHFPKYFKFFKHQEFVYNGKVHPNHNHLLGKVKGVDGIKTGFTNASGFNLAASMVRGKHRIIAVVMGGESVKARDKKMTHLLETIHANLAGRTSPQEMEEYTSIDDLLYALNRPEEDTDSLKVEKGKFKKAVYLSNSGKLKTIKASSSSLDEIFSLIDEGSRQNVTTIKKQSSKKGAQKKTQGKIIKAKKNKSTRTKKKTIKLT